MSVDDLPVGTVIDDEYEVERLIAKGGFSSVYRGRVVEEGTQVAIKVLFIGPETEATWIERFTREAQIVSTLQSPNTIRIYDWGQQGTDFLYTIMEYIAGRSLFRQIRRHGAMNATQVAEVALQVCNSLIEVHEQGFLHRDLKPSNVMLYRNEDGHVVVKVLDFGVVKILDPGPEFALQLTQQGSFIGTPRYAAPEQLRREPLTRAADVYGVGMIMWEALVGDPAVADNDYSACVKAHLSPVPWQLPGWVDSPRDFALIVEKALAKPVDQRYQSCVELQTALRNWLLGRSPSSNQGSSKPAPPQDEPAGATEPAPSDGGETMAKKDQYRPESLEDVEAEDELFGEIVEESDAHIEDVNVMAASDLSEASDANKPRSHITVAEGRKSAHAGVEPEDRPIARSPGSGGASNTILSMLLVVAIVAGALYLFTMGDDAPPTEPTTTESDETPVVAEKSTEKEEKEPVAPDSEMGDGTPTLDADTIAKGMVASGWKVGATSTDKMDEVLQTTAIVSRDRSAATLTIYESETWEWAKKLEQETQPPAKPITFGRTVVRVSGGPKGQSNGAVEATKTLWSFRKHARDRARGGDDVTTLSTDDLAPDGEGSDEAPAE